MIPQELKFIITCTSPNCSASKEAYEKSISKNTDWREKINGSLCKHWENIKLKTQEEEYDTREGWGILGKIAPAIDANWTLHWKVMAICQCDREFSDNFGLWGWPNGAQWNKDFQCDNCQAKLSCLAYQTTGQLWQELSKEWDRVEILPKFLLGRAPKHHPDLSFRNTSTSSSQPNDNSNSSLIPKKEENQEGTSPKELEINRVYRQMKKELNSDKYLLHSTLQWDNIVIYRQEPEYFAEQLSKLAPERGEKLDFIPINNSDNHYSLLVYEVESAMFYHIDSNEEKKNRELAKEIAQELLKNKALPIDNFQELGCEENESDGSEELIAFTEKIVRDYEHINSLVFFELFDNALSQNWWDKVDNNGEQSDEMINLGLNDYNLEMTAEEQVRIEEIKTQLLTLLDERKVNSSGSEKEELRKIIRILSNDNLPQVKQYSELESFCIKYSSNNAEFNNLVRAWEEIMWNLVILISQRESSLNENSELSEEYQKLLVSSENENKVKTILLIGPTGSGKSALANVITGTNKFKESGYGVSETKDMQIEEVDIDGIHYRIVDTVGLGDTKLSEEEVLNKLNKVNDYIKESLGQIFFFVEGKFTKEKVEMFNLLKKVIFGSEIERYTTIIRTKFPAFRKQENCEEDKKRMAAESKEIAEIIRNCNGVIHIDHINKEVDSDLSQKARGECRNILLNHLKNKCGDVYNENELIAQMQVSPKSNN